MLLFERIVLGLFFLLFGYDFTTGGRYSEFAEFIGGVMIVVGIIILIRVISDIARDMENKSKEL